MSELIWHVFACNYRAEWAAAGRLRELGYRVLHLHSHELRSHSRRMIEIAAPLYPGYGFLGREAWQGLMDATSCSGVASVLHIGLDAYVAPASLMASMVAMADASAPAVDVEGKPCSMPGCLGRVGRQHDEERERFLPGDDVVVSYPGGRREQGIVHLDEGKKVVVMLPMFGRVVRSEVKADWVRRLHTTAELIREPASERAFS